MSQQAPFELLLGRPWQRSNLVSIDEREEGTYLVFKDPETRRPRYELLAIPHEAAAETLLYSHNCLSYSADILDNRPTDKAHQPGALTQPPPPGALTRPPPSQEIRLSGLPNYENGASSIPLGALKDQIMELVQEVLLILQIWAIFCILLGSYAINFSVLRICAQISEDTFKRASTGSHSPHTTTSNPTDDNCLPTFSSSTPMQSEYDTQSQEVPPGEYQVLNRARSHEYGPRDLCAFDGEHPRIVQLVADHMWLLHRGGVDLSVRPGFAASPQLVYLGRDELNGQEWHHGVMLNMRLLIHNPDSGLPGVQNGHLKFVFSAAPVDNAKVWDVEVPYVPEDRIKGILQQYPEPAEAALEPENEHILGELRFGGDSADQRQRTLDDDRHAVAPAHKPASRVTPSEAPPCYNYITHPLYAIPPFNTEAMQPMGLSDGGDVVLRFDAVSRGVQSLPRVDTPRPPTVLLHECPPMARKPSLAETETDGVAKRNTDREDDIQCLSEAGWTRYDGTLSFGQFSIDDVSSSNDDWIRPSASLLAELQAEHERMIEEEEVLIGKRPATPPPVNYRSEAAELPVPTFNGHRGPVVDREIWSSSASEASMLCSTPEHSPVSTDYELEPGEILDYAVERVQRAPGLLVRVCSHSMGALERLRVPEAVIPQGTGEHFPHFSGMAILADQPQAEAEESEGELSDTSGSVVFVAHPRPLLFGGRPRNDSGPPTPEPAEQVQSPRPPPLHVHPFRSNELFSDSESDERHVRWLPRPEHPHQPPVESFFQLDESDTDSMSELTSPGAESTESSDFEWDPEERAEFLSKFYGLPNITLPSDDATEPPSSFYDSELSSEDSDLFAVVPTLEIVDEVIAIRNSLPYDPRTESLHVRRQIDEWERHQRLHTALIYHTQDAQIIRSLNNAVEIFTHALAPEIDFAAMAQNHSEDVCYIEGLFKERPVDDLVRLRAGLEIRSSMYLPYQLTPPISTDEFRFAPTSPPQVVELAHGTTSFTVTPYAATQSIELPSRRSVTGSARLYLLFPTHGVIYWKDFNALRSAWPNGSGQWILITEMTSQQIPCLCFMVPNSPSYSFLGTHLVSTEMLPFMSSLVESCDFVSLTIASSYTCYTEGSWIPLISPATMIFGSNDLSLALHPHLLVTTQMNDGLMRRLTYPMMGWTDLPNRLTLHLWSLEAIHVLMRVAHALLNGSLIDARITLSRIVGSHCELVISRRNKAVTIRVNSSRRGRRVTFHLHDTRFLSLSPPTISN
ncbi:hypothetical protein C8J57DRAFT_1514609 [Mycena rebaudengoi]|nr:hypothetical protein C8J57DRAFT_1514609 [Mycena rebaudengoi]